MAKAIPNFSAIDAKLTARLAALTAAQQKEAAKDGRFVQLLESHTTPPTAGSAKAADRNIKPAGETKDRTALGLAAPTEWSERVDVYDGPDGKGFVFAVSVTSGGLRFERTFNVGPETWHEQPWHEVEDAKQ